MAQSRGLVSVHTSVKISDLTPVIFAILKDKGLKLGLFTSFNMVLPAASLLRYRA